mmetsp:Transcript_1894/g.2369  ORF Transcript_1894/g.2369 Transcript_1894/m.2369 type:complete len:114 (+) Transcript_1894:419-760(+)
MKTELPRIVTKRRAHNLTSIKSSPRLQLDVSMNRANYEIKKSLQSAIKPEKKSLNLKLDAKKMYLLNSKLALDPMTTKHVYEKFKPLNSRGQNMTPNKVELNSKIHVSLHNLF